MATGRHLEDDFKLKKWYHKWIERFWNTRKTYLTLVYAIKITKLAYFRVFKMAAGGHLWCSNYHFNYIVTSLGIFHIFEITRNVWWFHIPWLAKKLRFLLKFRKSKMNVGRHLEDDFKTKIWYQNWIQWCWNTRKMYFTLVHHIKIN